MLVDLRQIKELVDLMDRHGLLEVELIEEGRKIRLRKDAGPAVAAAHPSAAHEQPPRTQSAGEPRASTPPGVAELHSPMVGTFYRASSPDADAFVDVGDAVKQGDTLCIIEAMKVMNEIKAETAGTIEKICVENGRAVEYGETLFLIRPE
jgi:acetyl-CoA carboxylase biotin carboxyl carrier protein